MIQLSLGQMEMKEHSKIHRSNHAQALSGMKQLADQALLGNNCQVSQAPIKGEIAR